MLSINEYNSSERERERFCYVNVNANEVSLSASVINDLYTFIGGGTCLKVGGQKNSY